MKARRVKLNSALKIIKLNYSLYAVLVGSILFTFGFVGHFSYQWYASHPNEEWQSVLAGGVTVLVAAVAHGLLTYFFKTLRKESSNHRSTKARTPLRNPSGPKLPSEHNPTEKFRLSTIIIVWIEREMVKLNREIFGEERLPTRPVFFQTIPAILLNREILLPNDIARATDDLVRQSLARLNED